jgi:hypothetical protein
VRAQARQHAANPAVACSASSAGIGAARDLFERWSVQQFDRLLQGTTGNFVAMADELVGLGV